MLIVTGATGLLGNSLVRRALGCGLEVTALLRDGSATRPLEGLALRTIRADMAVDALEPLLAGADCVIHAAARVAIGRRDLEAFRVDNVVPTARLAAACRREGVRLVLVSTVDTLAWGSRDAPGDETRSQGGEPWSAYAISKREAEDAVLAEAARGLDAVIVHPGFLLGPWDWKPSSGQLILAVARAPLALAPSGGNDFCHAEDVADGVLAAARQGPRGSRYVLGGEAMSYAEAFRLIRRAAGRSARVTPVPGWLLRGAGRVGDLVGAITGREPPLNSASAAIAALPHHFSSARAIRELGYRPRPAERAIRDAWAWFIGHGYA